MKKINSLEYQVEVGDTVVAVLDYDIITETRKITRVTNTTAISERKDGHILKFKIVAESYSEKAVYPHLEKIPRDPYAGRLGQYYLMTDDIGKAVAARKKAHTFSRTFTRQYDQLQSKFGKDGDKMEVVVNAINECLKTLNETLVTIDNQ